MLLSLPSELIKAISANLETTADKNALILTCRRLYCTLNDDMYRDVPRDCERLQAPKAIFSDNDPLLTWSSPLICAAVGDHAGAAKLLIDAGANVNAHGVSSEQPIIAAVTHGHVHVVRVLLAAAAKLDSRIRGGALLSYAAGKGNVEVVKLLLAPRSSISLTQDEVGAALEDAIQNGHQEVVRFLTQTGIDLERRVNNYRTPLFVACTRETNDMVRLLIDLGASTETPYSDGKPLLHKVISEGRPNFNETVTLLLDKNASIEARDRSGSTPLITAVLYYCLDTVKLLLSRNADVEARNNEGFNPLLLAICNDFHQAVRVLLHDGNADASASYPDGDTPLCCAVVGGHLQTVAALLEALPPGPGKTALIDTPDPYLQTPLFIATDIVSLLLSHGSKAMHIKTRAGRTPFSFPEDTESRQSHPLDPSSDLSAIRTLLRDPSKAAFDADKVLDTSANGITMPHFDSLRCNNCSIPISKHDVSRR
ncbi:hypothetical protein ASPCAL13929 [Aspergillus calidoustus]|uniref:Uncharacterized protein n=1 Tax=Aspergillus calidoustus TaxID=454130 RepID=A0A0U5H9H5_ASPCI|nr:hypothetical protein ASPCAL13929 [Aspergillus calidoustus]